MSHLFKEFESLTAAKWKEQIQKDLKGVSFNDLISPNDSGISIRPFYTGEDSYTPTPPLFTHTDWEVCEEVKMRNSALANQQALVALEGGASALTLHIYPETELHELLKEVSVQHICVNYVLHIPFQRFEAMLKDFLQARKLGVQHLYGAVLKDPLACLLECGAFQASEQEDFAALGCFIKQQLHLQGFCIDASVYNNAGAGSVFGLACTVAQAHEMLVQLLQQGIQPATLLKGLWLKTSVGADFFNEIARLRALRSLWALVAQEYELSTTLYIYAETTRLNMSVLDAANNMLRSTTEAMSAVLGGANCVVVVPYDEVFKESNAFSNRMARNQQLILKEESYLNKVSDIGSGSYYLETLTRELGDKAWETFKAIEQQGGWLNAVKSGYIQNEIEKQYTQAQTQIKEGKQVLLGVNKYPNNKEEIIAPRDQHGLAPDSAKVKSLQPKRLARETETERLTIKS